MAYWDEVEVSNPLGSRVKIDKLDKVSLIFTQVCSIYKTPFITNLLLALVKSKHLALRTFYNHPLLM